jgi:hypothetical protein
MRSVLQIASMRKFLEDYSNLNTAPLNHAVAPLYVCAGLLVPAAPSLKARVEWQGLTPIKCKGILTLRELNIFWLLVLQSSDKHVFDLDGFIDVCGML